MNKKQENLSKNKPIVNIQLYLELLMDLLNNKKAELKNLKNNNEQLSR